MDMPVSLLCSFVMLSLEKSAGHFLMQCSYLSEIGVPQEIVVFENQTNNTPHIEMVRHFTH